MPPTGNPPLAPVQLIAKSALLCSKFNAGNTAEPVRTDGEKLPTAAIKDPPKLALAP